MSKLYDALKISNHSSGSFKYIGLNVIQTEDSIKVDQHNYISTLKPINITAERALQEDDELRKEEKSQIRALGGQFLWVTSQTRPDASYNSCWVSNYGKNPTVRRLAEANKALKKLQSVKSCLVFPNLGDPRKWKVEVYKDTTHANLPTGASQGAHIIFISGNNRVAPVAWSSKKLNRVTKSPLASEASALVEAADTSFLVASIVQEVFGLKEIPAVSCKTDSKSLDDHLHTTNAVQDSRLRVDIARIREMVELGEITVTRIEGGRQLADTMTKAGASATRLLEVLNSGRL